MRSTACSRDQGAGRALPKRDEALRPLTGRRDRSTQEDRVRDLGIENKVVAITFAIAQPEEVDINEILFRPTRQEY